MDPNPAQFSLQLSRKAHWIVGIAGVMGFLASGLYMRFGEVHLEGHDRATRLSFRSIHIYLLFASLLNLAFARYADRSMRRWIRAVSLLASVFVAAAPALLGAAFVREPLVPDLDRNLTRLGVYAAVAGVALRSFVQIADGRPSRTGNGGAT